MIRLVKLKRFAAVFPKRHGVVLTFEADSAEELRLDVLAFYREDKSLPMPAKVILDDAPLTIDERDVLHMEWNDEHKRRRHE